MPYWPETFAAWVDVVTKILTVGFGVAGGFWVLVQYVDSGRLRATEALLEMEAEFRTVFLTFEKLEIPSAYQREIAPVLQSEQAGSVPSQPDLEMLIAIDRALRFLYLCVVLEGTLKGKAGDALRGAYYHYIAILLPEANAVRPELVSYTARYYPRLTTWINLHAPELRNPVAPRRSGIRAWPRRR